MRAVTIDSAGTTLFTFTALKWTITTIQVGPGTNFVEFISKSAGAEKILKKFAVGPDFHQDISNLRCGVGGWVRLGLLGLEG